MHNAIYVDALTLFFFFFFFFLKVTTYEGLKTNTDMKNIYLRKVIEVDGLMKSTWLLSRIT